MKIIILTEAGRESGFGHFTRCLALTQAFKEKGIQVELLVDGDESFRTLHDAAEVKTTHWRQNGDLDELLSGARVVIIDSYLASIDLYQKVSSKIALTLYLDDYCRLNYPKGMIWNGAIGVEDTDYGRDKSECLLGVDYALVRKEFWEPHDKVINDDIGRILVSVGGEDRHGVLVDLVKFLSKRYSSLEKRIIIPRTFVSVEEFRSIMDNNSSFVYHPNGQMMREEMLEADIAVSGGGQTLYELARMGVPVVGICLFENQRTNLSNWHKCGFVDFVVNRGVADIMDLIEQRIDQLRSHQERVWRSAIGRRFVGGQGARRVVEKLCERMNGDTLRH